MTPQPARGVDPVRWLAVSARAVPGGSAAVSLWRDGSVRALPGLADDLLLADGSPVTAIARAHLGDGQLSTSFLWPGGDPELPLDHVRVTVLAASVDTAVGLLGAVVLAPSGELHGLTPRELQVLGFVVEGRSNQQIAHALVVSPRTVATHLEHVLVKLDSSSRTLAAVRAQRKGLYVPPPPGSVNAPPVRS